jgi:DNA processing protein
MKNIEEEKIYYNSLNIASNTNLQLLSFLKKRFQTWKQAWLSNDYSEIEKTNRFQSKTIENLLKRKKEIDPEKEWQKMVNKRVKLILFEEKEYPILLKEIPDSPLGIYQKGNQLEERPKIAVVGTRKYSNYGKAVANKIVKELVNSNIEIVSGLAFGIDTISHKTAIENKGKTIAVLGSGFNHIFPAINQNLSEEISEKGTLISEYPIDTPPLKHQFPARNRIVSGLSLSVLVIEAPLKSGSLITARIALDQNRDVFAIPNQIFSINSEGTNELIKQGAKLVSNIEDILEELNLPIIKENKEKENLTKEEEIIFKIIKESEEPISVDDIILKSELDISLVNQIITFLELKNLISFNNSGYWGRG